LRIHHDDVRHGDERSQPAQHLPPHGRLIFLQLENSLDQSIPLYPQ